MDAKKGKKKKGKAGGAKKAAASAKKAKGKKWFLNMLIKLLLNKILFIFSMMKTV